MSATETSGLVVDDDRFVVALGTWFYKLLIGSEAGGLPAGFLTYASSVLLVSDEILCDQDAFDSEMDFASGRRGQTQWLSSQLFRELHDAKILKPVPYKALLAEALTFHRNQGLDESVLSAMELGREAVHSGSPGALRKLDPALDKVDDLFLMELGALGLLPYGWKRPGLNPERSAVRTSAPFNADDARSLSRATFSLPHVALLADPTAVRVANREAYDGYRANLRRERKAWWLWKYNDPRWTRTSYNDMRLGPAFSDADREFDRARERAARRNLDAILRIRDKTADERKMLQDYLRVSVVNRVPASRIKAELASFEAHYLQLLGESAKRFRIEAAVAGGAFVSALAAGATQELFVGAGATVLAAGAAGATGATARTRRNARRRQPIGYLLGRLTSVARKREVGR